MSALAAVKGALAGAVEDILIDDAQGTFAGAVEDTSDVDGSAAAVEVAVENCALWGNLQAKQVVDMLSDVERHQLQPVVKYL